MSDTTSTVTDKHGETKVLPTTFLSQDEADLLQNYQRWGELHHLYAKMQCGRCGEEMEVYVQGSIGMFCGCRALIWQPS